MSTKSPVSTICLVACANRASSRSIGGMLKNPGRNSSKPPSVDEQTRPHLSTGDSERHHGRRRIAGAIDVNPRAIERELDVRRLLAAGTDEFADRAEPA